MIALEDIFPPIPSELTLPLAGFLTGQGRMWFPGAVLASHLSRPTTPQCNELSRLTRMRCLRPNRE